MPFVNITKVLCIYDLWCKNIWNFKWSFYIWKWIHNKWHKGKSFYCWLAVLLCLSIILKVTEYLPRQKAQKRLPLTKYWKNMMQWRSVCQQYYTKRCCQPYWSLFFKKLYKTIRPIQSWIYCMFDICLSIHTCTSAAPEGGDAWHGEWKYTK